MTSNQETIPKSIKFLFGGLSGISATLVVQPLDLIKTRMQLSGADGKNKLYANSFDAIKTISRNEGISGLYSGLSAAILRQASYTTVRLGVYTSLFEYMSKNGEPPSFLGKAFCGLSAGIIGSFFGTPAEVCLIRMTSDGRLPIEQRRNYKNAFNALARIAREEGITCLWRGAIPTMGRAAVVNVAQLVSYSQAKQVIVENTSLQDGISVHFLASIFSGFVTTVASLPVDIAKTRIQNMKIVNGKPEYSGITNVISKVVKQEGVPALWKGFTPYFFRLAPHTVITFIALEQMNKMYKKFILHQDVSSPSKGL